MVIAEHKFGIGMVVDSDILKEYLGKNVVITLENNFKKFGKMTKLGTNFIEIEFYNDGREALSINDIKSIRLDKKGNGNGNRKQ